MIEKMRQEHQELLGAFWKMKDCVRDGPGALLAAKDQLLGHLKDEDSEFYPALRRIALTDAELGRLLEVFDLEMSEVSKVAEQFFSKYEGGCASPDFVPDLERLYAGLKTRIAKEENVLFAEYQRRVTKG